MSPFSRASPWARTVERGGGSDEKSSPRDGFSGWLGKSGSSDGPPGMLVSMVGCLGGRGRVEAGSRECRHVVDGAAACLPCVLDGEMATLNANVDENLAHKWGAQHRSLDIRHFWADAIDMHASSRGHAGIAARGKVAAGPVTFLSRPVPRNCGFSHSAQRTACRDLGVSRRSAACDNWHSSCITYPNNQRTIRRRQMNLSFRDG